MALRIGQIQLPAGAALAPMAGVADAVMRGLCAGEGAVFTVSEMASAKAIAMGDKKSRALLRGRGGAAPYGVQLFGHEAGVLAEAAALIEDEDFDFLDLNMGCPAHKIVAGGAGSALLKDPKTAGALAKAVVKASAKPVTAKLRIGWDGKDRGGLETALRCEEAGVALLTVHGRTRAQMYEPGVNFEAVAEIKRAVAIPVLFNGDVKDAESALFALSQTGCDGVMVGRAAMGNPWVFGEIAAALGGQVPPAPPSLRRRMATMDEQVRAMCEKMGEARAMRAARGVAGAYMKGLAGAAALRSQAHALTNYTDLAPLIERAYALQAKAADGGASPGGHGFSQ